MNAGEIEQSKAHIAVETIEYLTNSLVIETILNKSTENISVISLDCEDGLTEETNPFDTFNPLIDDSAEFVIPNKSDFMVTGQSIIMLPYVPHFVTSDGRFKMISTVIKKRIYIDTALKTHRI